jgi:dTDP-4-dehydrorhamnose 3,5-epimerase
MIDGVVVKDCVLHADDRGTLLEVIRDDEPVFREVRQTTFTVTYPGVIKAFHWHRRQWDVWFFSSGMAQVVLHDLREDGATHGQTDVYYMGEYRPLVIAIPPGYMLDGKQYIVLAVGRDVPAELVAFALE